MLITCLKWSTEENNQGVLRIFRIKESKVCIQISLSIHQESRDEIRQNPLTNWRKTTFLNGMTNVHNRGPKQLGQKEEREQVYKRD